MTCHVGKWIYPSKFGVCPIILLQGHPLPSAPCGGCRAPQEHGMGALAVREFPFCHPNYRAAGAEHEIRCVHNSQRELFSCHYQKGTICSLVILCALSCFKSLASVFMAPKLKLRFR